jgi:hypothetical protein
MMAIDYAEILTLLFRLQQSQLDADLARAKAKAELRADEEEKENGAAADDDAVTVAREQTSESRAVILHRRLVSAYALQFRPGISEDVVLYNAWVVAYATAENVATSGQGHGRLPQILEQIVEIEKREGMAPNELVPIGEGPADYQAAQEEYDQEL